MALLNRAFFLVGLKSLNSGAGFLISFFVVIVLGANEATDALFVAMFFPIEMIRMVARRLPAAYSCARLFGKPPGMRILILNLIFWAGGCRCC